MEHAIHETMANGLCPMEAKQATRHSTLHVQHFFASCAWQLVMATM